MPDLPDDDFPPIEPPSAIIGLPKTTVASGRQVVALPGTHAPLSPTLDVIGFPGYGYYIRVTDPAHTVVWSIVLECIDPDT